MKQIDKKLLIVLGMLILTALTGKYFDFALFVAFMYLIFS